MTLRQMLVPTNQHVVGVHIHDSLRNPGDRRRQRPFAKAFQVTNVDCQPQACGAAQPVKQLLRPGHCVDEHARLRLKAQHNPAISRMLQHGAEAVQQPPPERLLVGSIAAHSRPERHAAGPEVGRQIDRAAEKVTATVPVSGSWREQRRLMLPQRVEQVPGPRLNHTGHARPLEYPLPAFDSRGQSGAKGVE